MKSKQNNLFEYFDTKATKRRYGRTEHGGMESKGSRKQERPLSTKRWIHQTLKSDRARGQLSFLHLKNKAIVEGILREKARKFGIRIAEMVNVGNHIHLKIKISNRENFQNYLRSTTALIARKVTGAKKGKPFGRFWQGLAFTRVLMSSLEELNLRGYLEANRIEAGESYAAREEYLEKFNAWVRGERRKNKALKGEFSTG